MSVAAVQSHLHASDGIDHIHIGAYLTKLSAGLAASMIGPNQGIAIEVVADEGTLQTSGAVSLGLIVTELIINAIKYAFPSDRASARIRVTFEMAKSDWKLTVSDNGVGRSRGEDAPESTGLGTALIGALAKQLNAQITEGSSRKGLTVEVTRSTFESLLPVAA
jgi:chemotaxis protein methyltransferase CheR